MPFLTQGNINWKFLGKFIAFAILAFVALFSLIYHPYPILVFFVGILAISFLIAFFLDIFRKARKKPAVPISKEIPKIVRIFLSLVCLALAGLFWLIADATKGQSEPYGAILGMVVFFILLGIITVWWFCEFISLIIKLVKKKKPSKFQIVFVLIVPLIFIILIFIIYAI